LDLLLEHWERSRRVGDRLLVVDEIGRSELAMPITGRDYASIYPSCCLEVNAEHELVSASGVLTLDDDHLRAYHVTCAPRLDDVIAVAACPCLS